MKTKIILKRLVVWGFCHEIISQRIAQKLYDLFGLKSE